MFCESLLGKPLSFISSNSMDIVNEDFTMHHIKSNKQYKFSLQENYRTLKVGGTLILSDGDWDMTYMNYKWNT